MHILAFVGAVCRMEAAYAERREGTQRLYRRPAGRHHRDTAGLISLVAHAVLSHAAGAGRKVAAGIGDASPAV